MKAVVVASRAKTVFFKVPAEGRRAYSAEEAGCT
jgi:hypothetical protein